MRLSEGKFLAYGALWLASAGVAAGGLWLRSLDPLGSDPEVRDARPARPPPPPEVEAWPAGSIWAGPDAVLLSEAAGRYALAGTFQVFDAGTEESAGLVDDTETGEQRIVRRGDRLGPFAVGRIHRDRLILEAGDETRVLALSGETAASPVPVETSAAAKTPPRLEDLPAIETSAFGKKIKPDTWVLRREALMAYMDEMTRPEHIARTVNLYRSFRQVADTEEEPGFEIRMKAEQDFFRDMGLGDGDIIRQVNSMKMRNQRRAEYLLREFAQNRMSAVVLDVERDGVRRQQIYLVR